MVNVSSSVEWQLTGFASLNRILRRCSVDVNKTSVKFKGLFGNLKYQKRIFLVFLMTFAGFALE